MAKLKLRVLLTFVGSHDPYRGEAAFSGDGPVLSLLVHDQFNAVHLFYNNDDYLRRASGVLKEIQSRWPDTEVTYEEIKALMKIDAMANAREFGLLFAT